MNLDCNKFKKIKFLSEFLACLIIVTFSFRTLTPLNALLIPGDVYFMSEKATGFEWRLSSQVTLRHGTGRKAVLKRPRNEFE